MKNQVRELEARLIQGKSAVECLAVLLSLADLHAATFRNREGLRCAREALNIARARNDKISAARAFAVALRCHHQRGDYAAAVAAGLDAVEAFGEADLPGRSSALQGVARALVAVEAFDLADDVAQRAAADAAASGNPGGRCERAHRARHAPHDRRPLRRGAAAISARRARSSAASATRSN